VIEKRQVSPEMVARFQLGASPDMWDGLLKLIQSKKLEIKPFLGASLVRAREGGNSYFDFFRNRLMFPIHDQAGYVIGFGARKLREEDEPKYLNSPETILFNKSETLYGIHQAADTIRKSEQAILVEGYMDVIACHQAGLTNAVAALGTSLTAQGATRLARQCNSVVLLFDGDEAGAKAADRAVEVFFASPMDVKIATLTAARARGEITAKDPDELLKQPGGADKLRAIIAQASDALEYRMARLRQRLSAMSGTAKSQAVEEELKRLAELGLSRIAPIRREMVLKQIAVALGVSESLVRASVPFGRELGPARRVQPIELARAEPLRLALKSSFDILLACALSEPTLLRTLLPEQADVFSPDRFEHPSVKSAAAAVVSLIGNAQADRPRLSAALHEVEGESAAAELIAQIEQRTRGDSKALQRNWTEAMALAPKELAFARARASGDFDKIREAKLSLEHARASIPELLLK
jgi:DNA primase